MLLQYPDQQLNWLNAAPASSVTNDAMLLPAILNLLQNAAFANQQAQQQTLELNWQQTPDNPKTVSLVIRDFGKGFSAAQLAELGGQLMPSETGMGLAVMLSNVTFERLQGSLTLFNHPQGGAVAKVQLTIDEPQVEPV
jgi:two-component system sensor histidine kinase RegB